jgi:branched-chain amino acid aminotransferase
MASGLACIDGVLLPVAEARIPVTDAGLTRGDGVFEVVRLYNGVPLALERHLERMRRSADGLRLALDVEAVRGDVEQMLGSRGEEDDLLRVFATRGGHRIALFESLPPPRQSISLARVTYAPVRLLDQIKSLSYAANMLAGRLARERGFDDALLVSPHDRVLECPTSSIFVVSDGVIRTPPLSDHVLDSITRQLLLEVAEIREESITIADLAGIDEAFIASSVVEVLAVNRIEEHELAVPGPLTAATAALLRERVESGLER